MEPVLIAAIRYIDSAGGNRRTELDRLHELKRVVETYRSAHQGVSESSSNLRMSSSSMRSASAA